MRTRDASLARSAIASDSSGGTLSSRPPCTHTFNAIHPLVHVPSELNLAAEVTAHFIGVYA